MEIKHHIPKKLPREGVQDKLDFNKFAKSLTEAQYALGMLEGSQKQLYSSHLLIAPLATKEATVSSRIEGTQSTVRDVFSFEAKGEGKADTKEVANYKNALINAQGEVKEGREITSHLIESLHGILLNEVRHKGTIGKFRSDIVWIGEKDGDPISKALYVPMKPERVVEYMSNLTEYLKYSKDSVLLKTGIFHYQFEAIHPFNDGNGRMGRMLIPLILVRNNRLSSPILYISGFLEKHRSEYISKLHEVDMSGKYEIWLDFYFKAISTQLKETQELIDSIYKLYDQVRDVSTNSKSPYIIPFIDFIFKMPIFTIPDIQEKVSVLSRNTAVSLINEFEKRNFIIKTKIKSGKATLYLFAPLIKLL